MTNPDHVLDAIDAALADYTVSSDAMRCAPGEPEFATGGYIPGPAATEEWLGAVGGCAPWTGRRPVEALYSDNPEAAQAMAQHLSTIMESAHAALHALAEGLGAATRSGTRLNGPRT